MRWENAAFGVCRPPSVNGAPRALNPVYVRLTQLPPKIKLRGQTDLFRPPLEPNFLCTMTGIQIHLTLWAPLNHNLHLLQAA